VPAQALVVCARGRQSEAVVTTGEVVASKPSTRLITFQPGQSSLDAGNVRPMSPDVVRDFRQRRVGICM